MKMLVLQSNKILTRNVDIHATNVGKPGSMESFFTGKLGAAHEALMDKPAVRAVSEAKRKVSEAGIKYGLQKLDTVTAEWAYSIFKYHAKHELGMTDPKKIHLEIKKNRMMPCPKGCMELSYERAVPVHR